MLTKTHYTKPFIITPELTALLTLLADIQSKGEATVFFSLQGHVNRIHVMVFIPEWRPGKDPDYSLEAYSDNTSRIQSITEEIKREFDY